MKTDEMKIETALPLLKECVGVKFSDLFADLPADVRINKGRIGQTLLLKIGLKLDSNLTDFSDGELKTNKSDSFGNPLETMFITQISQQIDTLVGNDCLPFEQSNIFKKIQRLVFLPVCKDSPNAADWFFVSMHNIDLSVQHGLRSKIEADYYDICKKLNEHITTSPDGFIHTSSGQFIQIRSKDSKPYHPIYSKHYARYISNKNHAFYFKKEFMNYVREQND